MKKTLGLIVGIIGILLLTGNAKATIVTDDLISWWKFDETSGPTAEDSWGSNDGTLVNFDDGWTTDTAGPGSSGALEFDGSDDYVNLGNPVSLQITDELTIEYWVKLNSTQMSDKFANPIGKDHSGTEGVTLQIDHTDTTAPFSQYWHVGHGTGLYSLNYSTTSLLDDTWHQFVLTKSLTTGMAIYLDGALVSSNASYTEPIVYDTSDWNLGREATIATRISTMTGDDLRFYNRALSLEEIQQNYAAMIPEPSALLLLGMGLSGLLIFKRRIGVCLKE